jgi:phosphoserine phosphatase
VQEGVGRDMSDLPLAVDLDGTIILTDMSAMTIKRVLLRRPWLIPWVLLKEITGKRPQWKFKLAKNLTFEPSELTYHEEFMVWLKEQHANGRTLILCTASTRSVAQKISDYLGLFEDVMATDLGSNLAAGNKAAALVERFGEKGFGYVGNSKDDLKVWPHAGEVIVVNASASTRAKIADSADLIFD